MKICDRCGAQQPTSNVVCSSCGRKLGNIILPGEVEEAKPKINKTGRKALSVRASVSDKIIGVISLAGIVAAIVLMVIYRHNLDNAGGAFGAIPLFAFSSLNALAPQSLWKLEKIRLSFKVNNADEVSPSRHYLFMRKIFIYGFFIIAAMLLFSAMSDIINI